MEMNIALLPGDGIGPEVINQAVKVVKAIGQKFGHQITFSEAVVGAAAVVVVLMLRRVRIGREAR